MSIPFKGVSFNGCFSLNIQNKRNDASLFSLKNNEQTVKKNVNVGGFWTIQKITPKSTLLSLTFEIQRTDN